MKLIFILIIVLIAFLLINRKKYDIRFNTFFKRGLDKIDDRFGVYFVTGRQRCKALVKLTMLFI